MINLLAQNLFSDPCKYHLVSSWEEFCTLVIGQNSFHGHTLTLDDLEVTIMALETTLDVRRAVYGDFIKHLQTHHIDLNQHNN